MSDDSRINGDQHQLPALDRERLIFLNFQTAGQDRGSWPIEIGTARVQSDGSVRVQGNLIRPHPSWREDLWSSAHKQIHDISRDRLKSAQPADLIAAEYLELIAGLTIVSNDPEVDRFCLDMLAETIFATDTFDILGFNAAIAPFGFPGIKRAHAFQKGLRPSHRAGNDAARLAMAWYAACEGYS
jgi:DNA polymerase III epsilon subunit-like protein